MNKMSLRIYATNVCEIFKRQLNSSLPAIILLRSCGFHPSLEYARM